MGLLDYFDPDRLKAGLQGLLGKAPIVKALHGEKGRSFKQALLDMPIGDAEGAYEAALNVGPMMLGTFAGIGAKTANKGLLEAAKKMDDAGVDRAQIWNETGWFKGPDKKWRFEIDDSGAIPGHKTYSWGERADLDAGNSTTVRRQKALLHPQLSAAYPDTKNIGFVLKPNGSGGSYNPEFDSIVAMTEKNGAANKSISLHELQHAIQRREGFTPGGSPEYTLPIIESEVKKLARQIDDLIVSNRDDNFNIPEPAKSQISALSNRRALMGNYRYSPHEAYRALAGEAEARAVQARMDFDAAKRKQIPPWESYDIPWDRLIVRY